jgi:predicted tellurium resistance membrane protein TerC
METTSDPVRNVALNPPPARRVRRATPLLLVLACVELSDVLFAVDSIPAVFGVTQVDAPPLIGSQRPLF